MNDKHPTKYTSADVYDLSDRLILAASRCEGGPTKDLLREAGRVLLNRETTISHIRIMVGQPRD